MTENGHVFTWGVGGWGRLGLGEDVDVSDPSIVPFAGNSTNEMEFSPSEIPPVQIVDVACGGYHTVFCSGKPIGGKM